MSDFGDLPNCAGGFLQLEIGNARLLIAQAEVSAIESVMDLRAAVADVADVADAHSAPDKLDKLSLGTVMHAGRAYRVFSLDADLRPGRALPPARKICVCVYAQGLAFAIAADAVSRLDEDALILCPLPACMQGRDCPVTHLAIHGQQLGSVISIPALYRLIEQRQTHDGKTDGRGRSG